MQDEPHPHIVQQRHGHWSAWWEHEPQVAFGGATPAEAVVRLVGFGGDLPQAIEAD